MDIFLFKTVVFSSVLMSALQQSGISLCQPWLALQRVLWLMLLRSSSHQIYYVGFFFNLAEITDTETDPHLSPPPPFKPYCLALCSHVMHHIVVV